MHKFYIESISWDLDYNLDSDITLNIHHNGAAFHICYIAQKLAELSSLLEQHRNSYQILHKDDPSDTRSPEIGEHLRRPFEELMAQLAPSLPTESTEYYLHGYLYPPWFILEATIAAAESSQVQPCFKRALSRHEFMRPGEYVNQFLQLHLDPLLDTFNTYSSRQVQVLAHTARLVPSEVLVGWYCVLLQTLGIRSSSWIL